ncbi:mitochondrial carrier domain-containing protein [Lactifluus subvellereus]|nr:mitochondrial carrier domain-containing protein [Lactifluus subvellereus]
MSPERERKQTASSPFYVPHFGPANYGSFFLAGALCATMTHGVMTPIDVVKTRIQIDPALARHSLLSGGRLIVAKEGLSTLLTGFRPTAVGYFIQGGAKFAGYEFWKKTFVTQLYGHRDAIHPLSLPHRIACQPGMIARRLGAIRRASLHFDQPLTHVVPL